MEPIKYFDVVSLIEPKCPGCQHKIHYEQAIFDDKIQALTCNFCKTPL